MKQKLDKEHFAAWLEGKSDEELEQIADVFRSIGNGLPFERSDGGLVGGFDKRLRWVMRAFAVIIDDHLEVGASFSEELANLSEMIDAVLTEDEIKRLERLWQM